MCEVRINFASVKFVLKNLGWALVYGLVCMALPKWIVTSDLPVRKAAIAKLHDQKILLDLFNNEKNEDIRVALLQQLEDRKILTEIAESNKSDYYLCQCVDERLKKLPPK